MTYLFNFSHDELLSIKKLYERQLRKYNGDNASDIMGRASLHHMLGDIYMLEENFEQAIFEYQEALRSWKLQKNDCIVNDENNPNINKTSSQILFYIRLSLKLGLAYEKRKTFDTAYFTYEHLVLELLKIIEKIPKGDSFFNKIKTAFSSETFGVDLENASTNRRILFFNIRITFMAIIAKLFVLEKMDLGGFRNQDLMFAIYEFQTIAKKISDDIRIVIVSDFYTKLGEIFFYKNPPENLFAETLNKNDGTKKIQVPKCMFNAQNCKSIKPCIACLCHNISIKKWLKYILKMQGKDITNMNTENTPIEVLKLLSCHENKTSILSMGNIHIKSLCNSLVGLANAQLACGKDLINEQKSSLMHDFFNVLRTWISSLKNDKDINTNLIESPEAITPYMKAILLYWEASLLYKWIGEAKSAYEVCLQILNSIYGYFVVRRNDKNIVKITSKEILFVEEIAQSALKYAYDHYSHINFAEIDKLKQLMGIDSEHRIKLNDLSNYPDMERVLFLQYKIKLLSPDIETKYQVLKQVVNSSQMGWDKLICSLSQNIQNLDFKVTVNEQILLLLIPDIYNGYGDYTHDFDESYKLVRDFLKNDKIVDDLLQKIDWFPFKSKDNRIEKNLEILQFLVVDSLFALSKIADLISPLYCTTLCTNEYLAQVYEKGFLWGHLLRVLNTIQKDKSEQIEDNFRKIFASGRRNFEYRYLVGCARDYYSKAIEMHTLGKMYKEMMTMMYVLEDDLRNDTCYFEFAIEMMHMNIGYLDKCKKRMEAYYDKGNSLFDEHNYFNNSNKNDFSLNKI